VVTGESSLSSGYFDQMYADGPDPWDFTGRWYEERKRAITMASLPRVRFRRTFEPGCSIGLLSEQLAARSDSLLATDVSRSAVESARHRLRDQPGARVEQLRVPEQWPDGDFDLVVVSEIAYYCSEAAAAQIGEAVRRSLAPDGVLVLCHWLHPVDDYPLSGATAQRIVREASGLEPLARHQEPDFLLEVMTRPGTSSVAATEGLVG
jgi:SAM-dependent methyltransferase